jgi:hypothetical protein
VTTPAHAVVQVLHRFATERGVVVEGENRLAVFVEDLLFGERALWEAHRAGIATVDEVVDALLDRFLVRTFGSADAGSPPLAKGKTGPHSERRSAASCLGMRRKLRCRESARDGRPLPRAPFRSIVAAQSESYGGIYSSVGGEETIMFILRGPKCQRLSIRSCDDT